ncbi:hypothetical protein SAMN06296952_0415 [Oscillospiraceae bacterium]|nr:hypothetical protein SAMN06296952_0415 [Oscillospiraceae bacterium]
MKEYSFSPEQIGNVEDPVGLVLGRAKGKKVRVVKRFIDARHKNDIKLVYRVDDEPYDDKEEEMLALPFIGRKFTGSRPVVVGFGPAGMFAGLVLASYGLNPIIIEKGRKVEDRTTDVERYKKEAILNPSSNIQFGEGGAGTFSDGKLYTGVSSGLKAYIGHKMVYYGASEEILYDSHPHVGTDKLVGVVRGIREEIISLGGEVHFEEEFVGIEKDFGGRLCAVNTDKAVYSTNHLILAAGNSSRKLFSDLKDELGIMSKPFSVGVRIEHLREDIDRAMYGFDTASFRNICAANYKLAVDTTGGGKLYTFCMCPGGEVVPSASVKDTIVTNGMSYSGRDKDNSNAALLIPFDPSLYSDDPLYGMRYQEMLEMKAFEATGKTGLAPSVTYGELLGNTRNASSVRPSYLPGTASCDFREILTSAQIETLIEGIRLMGRKIRGFDSDSAVLTAPETRSSSPVRIPRDRDTLESVMVKGILPSGEGAGYAGGIMSSAIDGIKCANQVAQSMLN